MATLAKQRKIFIILGICVTVVLMVIAGTLAFGQKVDEVTNTFELGNVNILLTETEYPGNFDSEVTSIIPNAEVNKNPQIRNIGLNNSFVFLKITVPTKEVIIAEPDGTLSEKKIQELFFLKRNDTDMYTAQNSFNENWVELFTLEEGQDYTSTTRTYVFGYKNSISPLEVTNALFDKVQLKNLVNNEVSYTDLQNIKVEAFGVQTEYLPDVTTNQNMTEEQLTEIYRLFNN